MLPLARNLLMVGASAVTVIAWHPAEAGEPRWHVAQQSGSFLLRADFDLGQQPGLVEELEQLRIELFKTLQLPAPTETIELYLFGSDGTYRSYLEERFGNVPRRRALFIKAGGPGMVFAHRGELLMVDLRHETTHAFLHAALDHVPLWLDEGLAEYFEVPRSKRAADPHWEDLRQSLAAGALPALESLEALEDSSSMRRDHYIAAWGWTRFLLDGSRLGRDELLRYLTDVDQDSAAAPLSVRLRSAMAERDARFVDYFRADQGSRLR